MVFDGRRLTVGFILMGFLLATFLQLSEGRPHIRHHRGDSRCKRCDPGWGVVTRCGKGQNTECEKCTKGTYSPHHSTQPCWICSRCGPGLYEAHPCTERVDTVCDSCHRAPKGYAAASKNADYLRKCKGHNFFLAAEDAKNTGEQMIPVNEPKEKFYMDGREMILREDVQAALSKALVNE